MRPGPAGRSWPDLTPLHRRTPPPTAALDLQGNAVCGGPGSVALAAACTSLPLLASLNLRKTSCGDAFVVALARRLQLCPLLESLNLGANTVGAAGGRALVEWLASSPDAAPLLTTLGLRDSGLAEAEESAIAAVWPRRGAPAS